MTSIAPFLWFALAAFIVAVPGSIMLFGSAENGASIWRPRRLHLVRRCMGLLLILLALVSVLLAFSVYRYLQLFNDRPVAFIEFEQEAPQRFHANLLIGSDADGIRSLKRYVIEGDAWQLDARVLRWELPAALAGVPSLYRLERLSGRYDDIEQERTAPRSVYSLDNWNLPDLFSLKRQFPRWLPFVDAEYGNATWMPMFDNARYLVLFNDRGGLFARAADSRTAEMLERAE